MPVTAAVRQRCRSLLPPGEELHYVFPATLTGSGGAAHYLVVVTGLSITVLATKLFSRDEPAVVWARYPRRTRLGPVRHGPRPAIRLGDTLFEVEAEYVPVVAAADAEAFSPADLPKDPLPDL
ncbi:hypothetical protein Ssi03_16340 [Sphaerisporangium siamense]|uniref:Uncharacterized protein n=1 Tax=Sphaerisporangium siamense TaxID=795645 RepID=A0A7W7GCQ7_9ACTN|nr:hypothetical protein [Sphaerisporangium siamense]MBB4704842.1 hypothetical protein [Sphaerisporangium siamense]GII83644.1 hypothetical protein Ssi03_16340 [Sphaerisporangium siamense]